MVTYSESGVDIDLEAITVSKLASKLKSTLEYRDIITDSGHYAALVRLGDKAIGSAPTQRISFTTIAIQSIPTVSYLFIISAIKILLPTPSVLIAIALSPNLTKAA